MRYVSIIFVLTLCYHSLCAQSPVNDNCSEAIELTVNADNQCVISTEGTSIGATQSRAGCNFSSSSDDDVWYKFIATANIHKIEVTPNTLKNAVFEVLSGTCGDLTSLACVDNTFQDAGVEKTTLSGLTIGQAYFIRVHSAGNFSSVRGTFSICVGVPVPPTNDNCASPTAITINEDQSCTLTTAGNSEDATESLSGCYPGSNADDDVWFSFTATQSAHFIKLTNDTIQSPILEIFKGSCGSLESIYCDIQYSNNTGFLIGELVTGQTYFIRVYSYYGAGQAGSFSLCINEPVGMPVNDACTGALTLTANTVSCATLAASDLENATGAYDATCVGDKIKDDVWFKFTATDTEMILKMLNHSISSPQMELFSGACGNLSQVLCAEYGFMEASNLTIGQEYYLRVWSRYGVSAGNGGFDICLSTSALNDDISNAITLQVNNDFTCTSTNTGDNLFTITNLPISNSYGYCAPIINGAWYKFTALNDSLDITLTPLSNTEATMEVYHMVNGSPVFLQFSQQRVILTNAVPNDEYYILIYYCSTYPFGRGTYEICIKNLPPPPSNDNCESAISLPVNNNFTCTLITEGTSLNALGEQYGCNGSPDDDVWFSFVAIATEHQITVSPGTMSDPSFTVYEGLCGSLNELQCQNNSCCGDSETSKLIGLTIGETYYLQVYSSNLFSDQGTFSVCINLPIPVPPNDDCENAEELSPSASCLSVSGTNVNIESTNYDYCAEFEKRNVWYKFTATSVNHNIQLTRGTIQNAIIDVYDGGCFDTFGVSTCNFGSNDAVITKALNGLTIGHEYLFTVSTRESFEEGTFDICILSTDPPSNDECSGAIPLTVQSTNFPTSRLEASTINASESMPACQTSETTRDVWFSFTATDTLHRFFLKENSIFSAKLEVFAGSCGALQSIYCSTSNFSNSDNSSEAVGNLIIGNTYFVRVYSITNSGNYMGTFSLAITSKPSNNLCQNAINIVPQTDENCTSLFEGSNFDAISQSTYCQDENIPIYEVWYKFTATNNQHTVEVSNYALNQGRLEIYNGDCEDLNLITCSEGVVSGNSRIYEIDTFEIGNTYYFKLYTFSQSYSNYAICIKSISANPHDECNQAKVLNVSANMNGTYETLNDLGSTLSDGEKCNYLDQDFWLSFEATAVQHFISINKLNGSSFPEKISMYSGTCENLVLERCFGLTDTLNGFGELIIGENYFLRVSSSSFNTETIAYRTAILTPTTLATNDECTQAIILNVDTGQDVFNFTNGSFGITTSSIGQDCNVLSILNPTYDVWYKFTAAKTVQMVKLKYLTGFGAYIEIFQGTCTSKASMACSNIANGLTPNQEVILQNLTIGQDYFIRVKNTGRENFSDSFGLSVGEYFDEGCLTSIPINSSTGTLPDMFTADTYQHISPGLGCNNDGSYWLEFTASATSQTVWIDAFIKDAVSALYTGGCENLSPIYSCLEGSPGTVKRVDGLTIGQKYFLVIGSQNNDHISQGRFYAGLTSSTVPPNDLCNNAIELATCSSGDNCNSQNYYSNLNASNEGLASCNGVDGADVWFKFTADTSAINAVLENINFEGSMSLYYGTCGSLNLIKCNYDNGEKSNVLEMTNLIHGQTYFLRVFADTSILFKINLLKPGSANEYPLNDNGCIGDNLVSNPSFETHSICPELFVPSPSSPGQDLMAGGSWKIPTEGSSDYFNACAAYEKTIDVPRNPTFGIQYPHSGKGYSGFFASSGEYREYLSNTLLDTLQPGKTYLLSMFVSKSDYDLLAQNGLGFGLSQSPFYSSTLTTIKPDTVILAAGNPVVSDNEKWTQLYATFTADKKYKYLYLGNFRNQASSQSSLTTDKSGGISGGYDGRANNSQRSYYFVDDVFVGELKNEIACTTNPCNQNLSLISPSDDINNQSYQRITNLEIKANILIEGNSNVLLNSGKYILMDGQDGIFELKKGVVFEAKIEGCNN